MDLNLNWVKWNNSLWQKIVYWNRKPGGFSTSKFTQNVFKHLHTHTLQPFSAISYLTLAFFLHWVRDVRLYGGTLEKWNLWAMVCSRRNRCTMKFSLQKLILLSRHSIQSDASKKNSPMSNSTPHTDRLQCKADSIWTRLFVWDDINTSTKCQINDNAYRQRYMCCMILN